MAIKAIEICRVSRLNQGFHHPTYNPNGSKLASDGKKWYETAVSFTSISDCFTESKLQVASGYIGTTSARADGIFYNQVHEGSITDLRNSSQKVEDYNRLIDREFNKLVAGTYRGSEGEWVTSTIISATGVHNGILNIATSFSIMSPFNLSEFIGIGEGLNITGLVGLAHLVPCVLVDSVGVARKGISFISGGNTFIRLNGSVTTGAVTVYPIIQSTHTKSNTLTHCDIIGSPTNYPTAWKQSGVRGTPLIVAEDGTSLLPTGALTVFKNSRKVTIGSPVIYQVLKSTDSGATWVLLTSGTHYTFSTTTNAITMVTAPATTDLIMVTYQTHTNMVIAGVNSEVLSIGDVWAGNFYSTSYGSALLSNLISKIAINGDVNNLMLITTDLYAKTVQGAIPLLYGVGWSQKPMHSSIGLLGNVSYPTVKAFPYLTRSNGKARLQLVFKEMKYSVGNSDWGDDSTFSIVDNVSTTTDWYGQTILVGQKYAELPYFIEAKE